MLFPSHCCLSTSSLLKAPWNVFAPNSFHLDDITNGCITRIQGVCPRKTWPSPATLLRWCTSKLETLENAEYFTRFNGTKVRRFSWLYVYPQSPTFSLKVAKSTSALLVHTSLSWFCQCPSWKLQEGQHRRISNSRLMLKQITGFATDLELKIPLAAHLIDWQLGQHHGVVFDHWSN